MVKRVVHLWGNHNKFCPQLKLLKSFPIDMQNLMKAGIDIKGQAGDDYRALKKKIQAMRDRGLSYQTIPDIFNHWKIPTRSAQGTWHAKMIRDVYFDFI